MHTGSELKQARERAGLTVEQVAERTKIQRQKIHALEHSRFETLPNGIYLDGMVRAYAQEVGVDPEPLVQLVRKEQPIMSRDLYAASADLGSFQSEESLAPEPVKIAHVAVPKEQAAPQPEAGSLLESVVSVPADRDDLVLAHPDPPNALRLDTDPSLLREPYEPAAGTRGPDRPVVALSVLLAAIGVGVYLYDGRPMGRVGIPDTAVSAPRSEMREATEASIAPAAPENAAPNPPPGTAPDISATPSPTDVAASPAPVGTAGMNVSAPDVSGSWSLATRVDSTNLARFSGLQLGYEIQLEQEGDRVTGSGRKVTENSSGLRERSQTPISLAGTIEGDRLTLTFTERGARRPTRGKFLLLLDEGGMLRGRFSSTAARSAGTVEARRLK